LTVVHTPRYFLTYFEYDEATRLYEMSMHNELTGQMELITDANNGETCQFSNVLVIFAPATLYDASVLPKFNYGDGGLAFYFSQGAYEMVYWTKGGPNEAFLLYDWETREPLYINTGKSYIGIVRDKYQEDFHDTVRFGTASEVAQGGQQDSNITDVE
jgi:hypothetical protein